MVYHTSVAINMLSSIYFGVLGGAFSSLDMHSLAATSRSTLLCSKRPIMRSALNVSLRKM